MFPTPLDITKTQTFPIQKFGVRSVLDMQLLQESSRQARDRNGDLWLLQQTVFDARMAALKKMIEDGYHPVDDAKIFIEIHVVQRAISDEAGSIDRVPESMDYCTVLKYGE